MATVIKERFRTKLQKFADRTSIHGVNELYYATSRFWTVFWFIVVMATAGLTSYQVVKAFQQFINQTSLTLITPAQSDQALFPAIRLCYHHWMYWVDWDKAKNLNFSKTSLLYGLSYITKGFSSNRIDPELAKSEFFRDLRANNMSKLMEFYTAISADPKILPGGNIDGLTFSKRELIYKPPNLLFCYIINETAISGVLQSQENLPTSTVNGVAVKFALSDKPFENLENILTQHEYNYHVGYWLKKNFNYDFTNKTGNENFSEIILPTLLYPNAYSTESIRILPEIENYIVYFKVTAHQWKNITNRPCLEGHRSVLPDDKCFTKCHVEYFVDKCTCLYVDNAAFVDKDYPESLCPESIHYLPEIDFSSIFESLNQNCESECPGFRENDRICINKCLPACETWSYEMTVSTTVVPEFVKRLQTQNRDAKNRTEICIKYANIGDILVLTETDPRTWETLIGNIGGLLGIWMGASIVSFIQIIYLCCCPDCENLSRADCFCKKKTRKVHANVR